MKRVGVVGIENVPLPLPLPLTIPTTTTSRLGTVLTRETDGRLTAKLGARPESAPIPAFNGHLALDPNPPASSSIRLLSPPIPTRRHMYVHPGHKAEAINARLTALTTNNFLSSPAEYEEGLGHPGRMHTDPVTVIGRIIPIDGDSGTQRLGMENLGLEASRELGGGCRVPLDIGRIEGAYSFFPGRVVRLVGTNPTGKSFVVNRQEEGLGKLDVRVSGGSQCTILVASGPFTVDDRLEYSRLDNIVVECMLRRPSLLVLLGPFVDAEHGDIGAGKVLLLPDAIFRTEVLRRLEPVLATVPGLQVVLMPSLRDLVADPIFPQPSIQISDDWQYVGRIHAVPNPSILLINDDFTIAASTTDALFHLSAEEVGRGGSSIDRITRLLSAFYEQRSFYPLQPPTRTINMDYEALGALDWKERPDILLTTSQLRPFAKVVEGGLAVNGRRGILVITVHRGSGGDGDGHGFDRRCRVDFL